jgi:hypothetical protein
MAEPLTIGDLRARLEAYLTEHFGTFAVDADGDFRIDYESARVFVCPRQWRDKTVVQMFSVTNVELPLSDELARWLFGHFAFHEKESQVWFGHALLGDFLDAEELVTALSTVARTANKYDDLIKVRFGGKLYTEVAPQ